MSYEHEDRPAWRRARRRTANAHPVLQRTFYEQERGRVGSVTAEVEKLPDGERHLGHRWGVCMNGSGGYEYTSGQRAKCEGVAEYLNSLEASNNGN